MGKLTDNGYAKYSQQEKKYSLDGGVTWNSYNPKVYRMGNLIDMFSTDCGYEYTDKSYTVISHWNQTANRYLFPNGEMDGRYTNGKDDVMKIVIGNTVVCIGDYAIYACGVSSITIPTSVTYIGEGAFESSDNIQEMIYEGTVQQFINVGKGADAFKNTFLDYVQCTDGKYNIETGEAEYE